MPEASGVDVQGVLAAARAALADDAMTVQGTRVRDPWSSARARRALCKLPDDDAVLAASGATLVVARAVEVYVAWQATGGIGYYRDRRNVGADCRRLGYDVGTCRSFSALDVNGPQAAATRRA